MTILNRRQAADADAQSLDSGRLIRTSSSASWAPSGNGRTGNGGPQSNRKEIGSLRPVRFLAQHFVQRIRTHIRPSGSGPQKSFRLE